MKLKLLRFGGVVGGWRWAVGSRQLAFGIVKLKLLLFGWEGSFLKMGPALFVGYYQMSLFYWLCILGRCRHFALMSHKKLLAFQKGFELAMEIFRLTKSFPKEEVFALTSQIRNSSRSVCANLSEGYRKRTYRAHFMSKLTDADMENSETGVWLDFAMACGYLNQEKYQALIRDNEAIGRLIGYMINHIDEFRR